MLMEVAGEQEAAAAAAMGSSKEGENLMGPPTFTELENGRFKCVETGHELLDKDKDSYSRSKLCRLGLINFALSHNNPPLNMFEQDPTFRSKLICKLTGDKVKKTEEHVRKHMNGKRFLNKLEGNEQKRKRMKNDSEISRLSPSMRNQLDNCASLKGEQVAARVTAENAEKDEWFVVKVIHFDRETKEFEVLDEEPGDDEEDGGQRKYKLHMSFIIPFPKRNDVSSVPEFPPGRHVLAVYPGTTALYKATVVNTRKRKSDDYVLEFDDDEEDGALPQRHVPFYRVVPLPDGHRQ